MRALLRCFTGIGLALLLPLACKPRPNGTTAQSSPDTTTQASSRIEVVPQKSDVLAYLHQLIRQGENSVEVVAADVKLLDPAAKQSLLLLLSRSWEDLAIQRIT